MITFTKEQLSEVMCKHAEKENDFMTFWRSHWMERYRCFGNVGIHGVVEPVYPISRLNRTAAQVGGGLVWTWIWLLSTAILGGAIVPWKQTEMALGQLNLRTLNNNPYIIPPPKKGGGKRNVCQSSDPEESSVVNTFRITSSS